MTFSEWLNVYFNNINIEFSDSDLKKYYEIYKRSETNLSFDEWVDAYLDLYINEDLDNCECDIKSYKDTCDDLCVDPCEDSYKQYETTTYVTNVCCNKKPIRGIPGLHGNQGIQGIQGIQGVTGFQGIIGFQGIQGVTGLQGATSSQGAIGIQGLVGSQGATGLQGVQGIQGIQGIQGLIGIQGIQGLIGIQGIQGLVGSQGVTGLQGIQGLVGFQGAAGEASSQGATGTQGVAGLQGIQGLVGFQGAAGEASSQGATGTQGVQGIQGLIGFQGAAGEASSQGATGTQGVQGIQGLIGFQGAAGEASSQGVQGIQGLVGFQGAAGEASSQGVQGIQGLIGFQGTAGEASSQGATGTQGVQGIQGLIGFQGTAGEASSQGATGTQGVAGVQGIQGLVGFQGVAGEASSQGATGTQGVQGIQGLVGFQGAAGSQGLQGIQGIQGVQGLTGFQGVAGEDACVEPIIMLFRSTVSYGGGVVHNSTFNPTIHLAINDGHFVLENQSLIDNPNNTITSLSSEFNRHIALSVGGNSTAAEEVGITPPAGIDVWTLLKSYIDNDVTDVLYYYNVGTHAPIHIIKQINPPQTGSYPNNASININDYEYQDLNYAKLIFKGTYNEYLDFISNYSYGYGGFTTDFNDNLIDTDINTTEPYVYRGMSFHKGPSYETGRFLQRGLCVYYLRLLIKDYCFRPISNIQGVQGITGLQGIQGFTGYQGIQGIQGLIGSQGIQGLTGFQGVTGSQGIQGLTGFQGVTGSQGIQGLTGFQGVTGSQGIQGLIGFQGVTGSQGIQGITGFQGICGKEKEIILETISKITNTNIFEVRFRPGSKIPEDGLIHQNDNVTIIFNHSFDHDAKCTSNDETITYLTNDDIIFETPQMMVIVNNNPSTNTKLFDSTEDYIPVMYRFSYDGYYSSSPVIGIDPISCEKYAVGIQQVSEFYSNVINESGLETHHFIFEKSYLDDKSNKMNFTYGVGTNYETFYNGSQVGSYTFSISGMTANNQNLLNWATSLFGKSNTIDCLTKIGHFDTLHGSSNNPEQSQIDDIQNLVNDLIEHLTTLSNNNNCIVDPNTEHYTGSTPPPGTGGGPAAYLGETAYLVVRSVHFMDTLVDGRPSLNQMYIDVDANLSTFTSLNGVNIDQITKETHGWNTKYDYGVRPYVNNKKTVFGHSTGLSSSEKSEWNTFWKKLNHFWDYEKRNYNGLSGVFARPVITPVYWGNNFMWNTEKTYGWDGGHFSSLSQLDKLRYLYEQFTNSTDDNINDEYYPKYGVLRIGQKVGLGGLNVPRVLVLNMNHNMEEYYSNIPNYVEPEYLTHYSGSGTGVYNAFGNDALLNNGPFIFGKTNLYNYFENHLFPNYGTHSDKNNLPEYWKTDIGYLDISYPYRHDMNGCYSDNDRARIKTFFEYYNQTSGSTYNVRTTPWRALEQIPLLDIDKKRGFRVLTWLSKRTVSSGSDSNFLQNKYYTPLFNGNGTGKNLIVSYSIIEIFPEENNASNNSNSKSAAVNDNNTSSTINDIQLGSNCCCDNILMAERLNNSSNVFTLTKIAGSYPIRKNDLFTVIFNDNFENDLGSNGYSLVFDGGYGENGVFEETQYVVGVYRNSVTDIGATLASPIIGLTPETGNEYLINGNGYSKTFDLSLRSGAVHTFVFEKCVFYNNGSYLYGNNFQIYSDLLKSNSLSLTVCDNFSISEIPTEYSEYSEYFDVLFCASKIGDFNDNLSSSQGLQGIQGIQGSNGLQGIQGLNGLQGIQGSSFANGAALPLIKNLRFNTLYGNDGTIKLLINVRNKPYNLQEFVTNTITFQVSAEHNWMCENILTNNGDLPNTGGEYGIRFERIKHGKWTAIGKTKKLDTANYVICTTNENTPISAKIIDGVNDLNIIGTLLPENALNNTSYLVQCGPGEYNVYKRFYENSDYVWKLVNTYSFNNYMFMPFNKENMDVHVVHINSGNKDLYNYIFKLKNVTTMGLMNSVTQRNMNDISIYTYKEILENGSNNVEHPNNILFTYNHKKIYIKGETNSLTNYYVQNNSRYTGNAYPDGIAVGHNNRFSFKCRIGICTYNGINQTSYEYYTPYITNWIEFNVILGKTKFENDGKDGTEVNNIIDPYNGSLTNLVFIRGKLSKGIIPFNETLI